MIEYINDLKIRTAVCTACKAHTKRRQPLIGSGPVRSPVMVVFNRPNSTDNKNKLLLQGTRGRKYIKLFKLARYKPEKLFFTPITKCYPGRLSNYEKEVICPSKCKNFTLEMIDKLKPQLIILIGPEALIWTLLIGTREKFNDIKDWKNKFFSKRSRFGHTQFLVLEDPCEWKGENSDQEWAAANRALHESREYITALLDGKDIPILNTKDLKAKNSYNYIETNLFDV